MRPLTSEERIKFDEQRICYLCKGDLGADRDLDHCHYTGEPIGNYIDHFCMLIRVNRDLVIKHLLVRCDKYVKGKHINDTDY